MNRLVPVVQAISTAALFFLSCSFSTSISAELDPRLRGVTTLGIEVHEQYFDGSDDREILGPELAIEKHARKILKHTGLTIEGAESAEAILKISLRGEAHGRRYHRNQESYFLYLGATVSGTISLSVGNVEISKKEFKSSRFPAHSTLDRNKTSPNLAPWKGVFLQDSDRNGQAFRLVLWRVVGDAFGPAPLASGLKSSETSNAASALVRMGAASAYDPLIARVNSGMNPSIAWALGSLGDPRAVPKLKSYFLTVPHERQFAATETAEALARLGDQGMEALTQVVLYESDFDRHEEVARALRHSNHKDAARLLVALLNREGKKGARVRYSALESLEILHDKRTVAAVLAILVKDRNYQALEALRATTKEDFGFKLDRWQKWWELNENRYPKQITWSDVLSTPPP